MHAIVRSVTWATIVQGSFCVKAQPMRDTITLQRRHSLTEPIPRTIPVFITIGFMSRLQLEHCNESGHVAPIWMQGSNLSFWKLPFQIPSIFSKILMIQDRGCLLWDLSLIVWSTFHDDVIKWRHFPRYWPFVRGIHRWPVNSPHKGQWRAALMFFFICVWINGWVNNREAGDLRRYRAHYDIIIM